MIKNNKAMMLRVFLLVVFAISASACSPLMIQSDPAAFPINPEEVPKYNSQPSISVGNAYDKSQIVTISTVGRGLEADLQQYTQTTVDILSGELDKQSINVRQNGDKDVILRVHDVVYEQGFWVLHTTLNLEAKLGNGETIVTEGDNRSPGNAWRSVNGALKRAVVELMKNQTFVDYIEN
jgi:hypothetical protein